MTVTEYEAKFTELSRFVPDFVNTEEKRARRFQLGLKQWIQNRVAVLELTDYATLVQKATIVEAGSEQMHKEREGMKRKFENQKRGSSSGTFPNKFRKEGSSQFMRGTAPKKMGSVSVSQGGRPASALQSMAPRPPIQECKICGKRHPGKCNNCFKCGRPGHFANNCPTNPIDNPNRNITCFKCGQKGHISPNCRTARPTMSGQSAAASNKPPTARTFNMTVKDAVRDAEVIAGTLLLNSTSANVLFDSGATKSFISSEFVNTLGLKSELLKETLHVEIANQEVISVSRVYPKCNLEIEGRHFLVDLIPFKLGEFDVILGMDWLSANGAQIDCKGKKVKVRKIGEEEVLFRGQRQTRKFLTSMQVKRLLRQGCETYLAYVIDTVKETPKPKDIPVVKEFEDVFPEDLPGLPPDRDIEFAIELAPGTAPVSKAPYRLAPVEMKEQAL